MISIFASPTAVNLTLALPLKIVLEKWRTLQIAFLRPPIPGRWGSFFPVPIFLGVHEAFGLCFSLSGVSAGFAHEQGPGPQNFGGQKRIKMKSNFENDRDALERVVVTWSARYFVGTADIITPGST